IGGDGIGAGVAFVVVSEADVDFGLAAGYFHEGDANRCALPQPRAEVGVEVVGCADGVDVDVGVGMNGQVVHRCIPDVVCGKDRTGNGRYLPLLLLTGDRINLATAQHKNHET
ncbi:MAG: hypothetical protein D6706_13190, partial [Chloroflexi bacterium]